MPTSDYSKTVSNSARYTTRHSAVGKTNLILTMVLVILIGASAWQGWQFYSRISDAGGNTVTVSKSQAEIHSGIEAETQARVMDLQNRKSSTTRTIRQAADAKVDPESGVKPVKAPHSTKPVPSTEENEIARLLALAEADMEARRLTSPVGNNAWDKYQRVMELEPAHPEAVRGMGRVIESYMELFRAAVGQENFDKATGYLMRVRELHPDSPVLEAGERQLEDAKQARAGRLAELELQRQEEEAAARAAELERQRIEQVIKGHWLAFEAVIREDALDKAAGILAQVRELNPDEPGLVGGEHRLGELERLRQEAEEKARQYAGEMIEIPGGTFRMGRDDFWGTEEPVHSVTVRAYRLGKYEVTFDQWDACMADGGCGGYRPNDRGWGRGNRPVIHVSWDIVQSFIDWLNSKTGGGYRLPTEAEWEYATRAGSTTEYSWGNDIGNNRANCNGCGGRWDGAKKTAPVGSYSANAWGLHDMHGNVSEWVEDCWKYNYRGAPIDGSAWITGDCSQRGVRGGSWAAEPRRLFSASRNRVDRSDRNYVDLGFRLAQDK